MPKVRKFLYWLQRVRDRHALPSGPEADVPGRSYQQRRCARITRATLLMAAADAALSADQTPELAAIVAARPDERVPAHELTV
jgi:hypothetical protein